MKMDERYRYIYKASGLKDRSDITYTFGFNEECFVLGVISHTWGGNVCYETLAKFYPTMSDEQIISAIKVIIGVEE